MTNTHTHASLALPHDILCLSMRSTALKCSLCDSINFLLLGIPQQWHAWINQAFYLLKTHQIHLDPH